MMRMSSLRLGGTEIRAVGIGAVLALVVIVPVAIAIALAPPEEPPAGLEPMPDFTAIDDAGERKARFIAYIRPVVEQVNGEVRAERERLQRVAERWREHNELGRREERWLNRLAARYRLDPARDTGELVAALRRRVDTVPTGLAVAQAAKESGWGTSRFARQGNNLFGEWCYTQGCGLVPGARAAGASHEVEAFATVGDSVRSYIRNLNTNNAYRELRDRRARMRAEGKDPTALALAAGLRRYSERGQAYVDELRALIRSNDLE